MRRICTPTTSALHTSRGERAISRVRMQARLAVATLGTLALIAPAAAYGQGLDRPEPAPAVGPCETVGRAGVGAPAFPSVNVTSPAVTGAADLAQRDTSGHHGSRAHHAAVGALVGGGVGLALGVVGDGMWFGRKPERSHFRNLWHYTAPFGALIGALAGTLRQAD